MMKNLPIPASDLPVMKSCCKSCPFRKDERGLEQDTHLAAIVTSTTLFQSHQICHSTEGENREPNDRCHGSYVNNKKIYDRMGFGHLVK